MFTTTKDFDKAKYNMLSDINNSTPLSEISEKFETKTDFDDILENCCSYGLINGVTINGKSAGGRLFYSMSDNVRLTRSGLGFIETYKV